MERLSTINRWLQKIEAAGNRLPHPTTLFIYLCGLVLLLSWLCAATGVSAIHPLDNSRIDAVNLLSRDGLQQMLANTVTNFTHFAPVGTLLVAVMGIGIAEHAGLIGTVLKATVLKAPRHLLTFIVVLTGVLSSLAADTGYVVLIPLAAIVFRAAGRSPVAGIAAAFAGVSGGFSANLLIGPIDAILAGLSTEAAQLIKPDYVVTAAGNYYFIIASTVLIGLVGTWVTERLVLPRFAHEETHPETHHQLSPDQRRGLTAVGWFSLVFIGLLLWGLLPDDGLLRHPDTGSILRSPFISGIVTIIAAYCGLSGWVYGKLSGSFNERDAFIKGMESSMETMASYLVLMFFAAQFVSYFSWSQLGLISAVKGASLLQQLNINSTALLVSFVLFSALINLLIGSASAKWALLSPIFVPMLLLSGISPEATQMAYRVGDSSTNIITPLMPYFGVVVAYVQRYDRSAGMGTVIATMLPYSIAFLIGWSLLLTAWLLLDWPLGPGAPAFITP